MSNDQTFQRDLQDANKTHNMIAFLNRCNLWQSIEVAVNKFVHDINENGEDFRLAPLIVRMNFDMTRIDEGKSQSVYVSLMQ